MGGALGSVMVKVLCYKSEGPWIDSWCHRGFFPWHLTVPHALGSTLLLLEALQLQRSFGLLNKFFPFGSVSDAVLPVSYSHVGYITFYIILPPVFRSSF